MQPRNKWENLKFTHSLRLANFFADRKRSLIGSPILAQWSRSGSLKKDRDRIEIDNFGDRVIHCRPQSLSLNIEHLPRVKLDGNTAYSAYVERDPSGCRVPSPNAVNKEITTS